VFFKEAAEPQGPEVDVLDSVVDFLRADILPGAYLGKGKCAELSIIGFLNGD